MQASADSILIVGSNGGFGQLFARRLLADGLRVRGIDLHHSPQTGAVALEYYQADATLPGSWREDLIACSGCILLCIPESAAMAACDLIIPAMAPAALFVDTLSVKTPLRELPAMRPDIELLSLNPLFAPDLDFPGQNVAAVLLRDGCRSQTLLRSLRTWGAHVRCLGLEEHDRAAAAIQVAAHAAILAYGVCLLRLGYQPDPLLFTPPHRTLLALLARIATRDPEVYRHIQTDNPLASAARAELGTALEEFSRATASAGQFQSLLDSVRGMLENVLPSLLAQGRQTFQFPDPPREPR